MFYKKDKRFLRITPLRWQSTTKNDHEGGSEVKNKLFSNEKGAVLILSLMILALLSILSTTVYMNSTTDMKITANIKKASKAFHLADGSTDIGPGIIERAYVLFDADYTEYQTVTDKNLTIRGGTDSGLFVELTNYTLTDPSIEVKDDNAEPATVGQSYTDIEFVINGSHNVAIDIDFIGSNRLSGGSTESQSRYEGIGGGSSVIADRYRIHSVVEDSGNRQARVETRYQRIEK